MELSCMLMILARLKSYVEKMLISGDIPNITYTKDVFRTFELRWSCKFYSTMLLMRN